MVTIPEHLLPSRFPLAQTVRTVRSISPMPGTTIEMVLDPNYWVHGGGVLKVNDLIEVIAQDGSFELELRVIAVDARGYWAHVRPRYRWPAKGEVIKHAEIPKIWPDKQGYRIELNPIHRWRVIDRTGAVISRDHPDEATAIAALDEIKREKKEAA